MCCLSHQTLFVCLFAPHGGAHTYVSERPGTPQSALKTKIKEEEMQGKEAGNVKPRPPAHPLPPQLIPHMYKWRRDRCARLTRLSHQKDEITKAPEASQQEELGEFTGSRCVRVTFGLWFAASGSKQKQCA